MADTWPTSPESTMASTAMAGLAGGLPGIAASLGSAVIGKIFGKKDNSAGYWNEVAYNENRRQFYELQHNKIKNAANDARAAGLHPLFALGAGGAGHSPVAFMPGQSYTGSGPSDVAVGFSEALRGAAERMFPEPQQQDPEAQSRIDANYAEAEYYRSMARRAAQAANSRQDHQATDWEKEVDPATPEPVEMITPHGSYTTRTPGRTTAEEAEEQYGEVGELIYGTMNAGEDLGGWIGRTVQDFLSPSGFKVKGKRESSEHPGWHLR